MKISYTKHAFERMKLRQINKHNVVDALLTGAFHYQSPNTYKVHCGAVVLIVNESKRDNFTIVTVLHGKKTSKEIQKKKKKFDFGYKKACKLALSL